MEYLGVIPSTIIHMCTRSMSIAEAAVRRFLFSYVDLPACRDYLFIRLLLYCFWDGRPEDSPLPPWARGRVPFCLGGDPQTLGRETHRLTSTPLGKG